MLQLQQTNFMKGLDKKTPFLSQISITRAWSIGGESDYYKQSE